MGCSLGELGVEGVAAISGDRVGEETCVGPSCEVGMMEDLFLRMVWLPDWMTYDLGLASGLTTLPDRSRSRIHTSWSGLNGARSLARWLLS